MIGPQLFEQFPKTLNSFLLTFPWIHMAVGLLGNVSFVIGSILFLLNMSAAVFFVMGSIGMLLGSAGYMFVEIKTRGLRDRGHEPYRMATLRKVAASAQSAGTKAQQAVSDAARKNGSGRASG